MLEVAKARVSYGDHVVVNDVDLRLERGEVVGLLGPSGAGKSTLLRAIVGLVGLDSGSIVLDGVDLSPVAVHQRGIGLMLQDGLLFPHRDVAGNVAYGLLMQNADRATIEHRVREVLELVGLQGFESRSVDTLSGGQQQRVALARSLAPSPRVLLLDEPFGALDLVLRSRLVEDVQRLVRALDITVISVSHDRHEAFTWCDRVAVMDSGRLIQDAAPVDLMRAPSSPLVAALMGMRLVPGAVFGEPLSTWAIRPWLVDVIRGEQGAAAREPGSATVHRCVGTVVARVPVGDRVRVAVRPLGAEADVTLDAETNWDGAPVVGEQAVVDVPEAAITRLSVGDEPASSSGLPFLTKD